MARNVTLGESERKLKFVAFDLGAESGRAMLAEFDGDRLSLSETYRFENRPVRVLGHLYWDVLRLWGEMKTGLAKISSESGHDIAGIGVDTWGVDFGLLNRGGELMGIPHHYRDQRTRGMLEEAFRRVPREEIFERTGIQFMEINTLYQLLSMVCDDPSFLDDVDTFLMMPDLFNYWLTGERTSEYTIATTSQCYDPRRGDWARSILERMGIPTKMFLDTVQPGTVLGKTLPSLSEETNLREVSVIAPACHDTGSAMAAIPAEGPGFACISSGTWSTVGAECDGPIIDEQTLQWNFTNEGGVCGTIRLLRNVAGLWLVQQCRQTWASRGESYSYDELTQMADEETPFQAVIDPDHSEFLRPGDMPARIQEYCRNTGQPVPSSKGAIVRGILEGLALKYRLQLERLEQILGRRLSPIHIVGGGTKNRLLNQLTADATGRPVLAGPAEATTLGNVSMQLLSLGKIGSLWEGRDLIRRSFPLEAFEPRIEWKEAWDQAYHRLLSLA
ncbi:MAG: rhamnulokinase [bacterium]